jgi:hypothetical protein
VTQKDVLFKGLPPGYPKWECSISAIRQVPFEPLDGAFLSPSMSLMFLDVKDSFALPATNQRRA